MNEITPPLGSILRSLRAERGMTLDEVSANTGVSKSMLSKVENGKMSLTYDKLFALSRGLEVPIEDLFASDGARNEPRFTGRRTIGRAGEGRLIKTVNYGDSYLAADFTMKKLIPVFTRIKARTIEEFGPMSGHPGEEFTYVLEGTVDFHCEAYETTRLEAGDYIYFDSTIPHAYISVGRKDAKILTVMSAPDPEHF